MPDPFLDRLSEEEKAESWGHNLLKHGASGRKRVLVALGEDAVIGFTRVGPAGEEDDEVGLVYLLYVLPEYWGRGLAVEASSEALGVGFDLVGLESIVAFTLLENARSRRVMEKCGLTYERDIVWHGNPHVLYRITATQYHLH